MLAGSARKNRSPRRSAYGRFGASFSPEPRYVPLLDHRSSSHTIAPELNETFRASRNREPPYDGITEVWVNSQAEMGSGGEAGAKAGAALVGDERRFVQMDRSRLFLTREHVIFDHTA